MHESYLPTQENPGRILVAMASDVDLQAIQRDLRASPYHLTLSCGAVEAFENCTFQSFEGVLLEQGLSSQGCQQLSQTLHDSELNAQTPLIFLASQGLLEITMAEGLSAGAMDCVAWPSPPPDLLAKLRMMVRFSRQQRDLLLAERQRALVEIAGGAALEVWPYLRDAQALIDGWKQGGISPQARELEDLTTCLDHVQRVLAQIQSLRGYITKSHGPARVLDLAGSSQGTVPLKGRSR